MMKQETRLRVTLAGLTLLVISGLHQVQGGCSRYGHSCFGAHGKRTDPGSGLGDLNGAGGPVDMTGYNNVLKDLYSSYQQQQASRYPGRMSPYLFEWALAAQRAGDLRQPHELSKEDGTMMDMRRK